MEILEKQTREADMRLLNQYKKELNDLEKGIGLARYMCQEEIRSAMIRLGYEIKSFKGYLY